MENNAFFKVTDPTTPIVDNFQIPDGWWSRPHEYAFALQFAGEGLRVADMGTGWTYRPLRYELAHRCEFVYAVDTDHRVMQQPGARNLMILTGNFSHQVNIDAGSMDRVFCVSVLEDIGTGIGAALREFARLIQPEGRIVLTMDSQYDMARPFPVVYPGVNIDVFLRDVALAGLAFDGPVNLDKTGALVHEEWNLCCFHCVLRGA